MTRRLAVLAAALVLAGCASMAPRYERPAPPPLAPQFPGAAGTAAGSAADLDWTAVFPDARTQRLVTLALQNNRDLRGAVAAIEQARARAAAQGAAEWPVLGAAVAGSRAPRADGGTSQSISAGVGISAWEIDLFGRLRSLSDAAQAQWLASAEARKAVQISLVGGVASGVLALAADDELLALARQTLDTRVESLRLVRLRADRGVSSDLDLQQAVSLVEATRATLAQLQRQRALDENALVLLVGQPLPADLPATPALAALPPTPELPVGLPADTLLRRPDVRQAELGLVAANANIGAARAALFPQVTLTATAGSVSSELSGLFKGGSWGLTVAPQLLYTIFDFGRNRANLAAADAARDAALAQYEKAIQTAFREVADALAGRQSLAEQLRALQAQAEAETARTRLAELRYTNGVASSLEWLDAQRSLFAVQQQVLQARLAWLQSAPALYKALGGGWREPGNAGQPAS